MLFQAMCHFPCKLHALNAIMTVCIESARNSTKCDGRVCCIPASHLGGPALSLGPTDCLYYGLPWFSSVAPGEYRDSTSN
jgi:hypothetical protein